jgi:hypothetical protein
MTQKLKSGEYKPESRKTRKREKTHGKMMVENGLPLLKDCLTSRFHCSIWCLPVVVPFFPCIRSFLQKIIVRPERTRHRICQIRKIRWFPDHPVVNLNFPNLQQNL